MARILWEKVQLKDACKNRLYQLFDEKGRIIYAKYKLQFNAKIMVLFLLDLIPKIKLNGNFFDYDSYIDLLPVVKKAPEKRKST